MDPMVIMMQLIQMGVNVRKHSGAYWEQSLSLMLYQAVEENYDYALTVDYDTVFRPSDVRYMLHLIVNEPSAAAVFPVQYRREADQLLVGLDGHDDGKATVKDLEPHLVPASLGHFGLTLIRVSALKQIPHPWLQSMPNRDGVWGPGKLDADIAFWHKLKAAGLKAFCATRVVVGHMQQMITWPGENYQPVHQYAGKYFGDGDAPPEVITAAKDRALSKESFHAVNQVPQDGDAGRLNETDVRGGGDLGSAGGVVYAVEEARAGEGSDGGGDERVEPPEVSDPGDASARRPATRARRPAINGGYGPVGVGRASGP